MLKTMNKKFIYTIFAFAVLLFLKGTLAGILKEAPETNLYVLQAQAFLQGRWDIGLAAHDAALFQGRYYVAFPPFPALLLVPFVWAAGVAHTNVVLISVVLTGFSAWVLFRILQNLRTDTDTALWILMGFFMGTAYWMAVKGSFGVWHFAHVVAIAALFLAINEALGSGRGWLVGLYLSAAFLSRHMTIYALPFLACALWSTHRKKSSLFGLLATTGAAVAVYLGINWLRFNDPLDVGYSYILQIGFLKERLDADGLFNINYFPFNFVYLFLQGFHVQFEGTTLLKPNCLDPFGTSLTFSSPFLFVAFWAKWKKSLLFSAWTSIGLILIHSLFYYSNGYYQINAQRFTLDFMPLLIVLTALGAQRCNPKIWKPLILYSIALNELASIICSIGP